MAHLKTVGAEAKGGHDVLCQVEHAPNLRGDLARQAEDVRVILQAGCLSSVPCHSILVGMQMQPGSA